MSESARLRALAGEYEIVRTIATGGMGSVHEVRSRRTGQRYAAKVLLKTDDARARERFRREAELLARCDRHPGIVKVHALIDSNEGTPSLIMDFVEGQSLDQVLDRSGKLETVRATAIALGIAEALAFAHERGIVHRDVKPANVLLDRDGKPRLTDFGLATARDVDRLTRTGQFVGTIFYCAPEQVARAKGEVLPTADVYSLGAVLFHMLAGEPPVTGDTVMSVLSALHDRSPVRDVRLLAPGTPPGLAAIVARCLEKDARRRYESGAEVARELASFGATGKAPSASTVAPPARRRLAAAGIVALLLGTVAVGAALGRARPAGSGGAPTVETAIALARSAVATGDGQGALAALERAPGPLGPEGVLVRGRAFLLLGRAAEAEKIARDAPPALRVEARELEGDALLAENRYTNAQIAYSSVLDEASSDGLRVKRARAAALASDDQTALADFAKLVPDPFALPRERARNARYAALAPLLYRRGLRVSSTHTRDLEAAWRIAPPSPGDVPALLRIWREDAARVQKELALRLTIGEPSVEGTFELFMQVVPLWNHIDQLEPNINVAAYWDATGLLHAWTISRRWESVPTGPELADQVLAEKPNGPVLLFMSARTREPFRARWREALELYERASEALPKDRPEDPPEASRLALDIAEGALKMADQLGEPMALEPDRLVRALDRAKNGHVWSALAVLRARKGDFEKAWADQMRAEAIGNVDEDRWIGHDHVDILAAWGRLDEAVSWARALHEGGGSLERLEVLCYALRLAKRPADIVAVTAGMKKPSAGERTAGDLLNQVIDAHVALGQFDAAREKARLFRDGQPEFAYGALVRVDEGEAVALVELGKRPEALAASAERLRKKPGGITIDDRRLLARAILDAAPKRPWPAGLQLVVDLTDGATDTALLLARGKALALQRRYDDARALALGPLMSTRRASLELQAFVLDAQGNKDEALAFLTYEQERARDEDSLRLLVERLLGRSPRGTAGHDGDCDEIVRRVPFPGTTDLKLVEMLTFAFADRGQFAKAFELGQASWKKKDDAGRRMIVATLARARSNVDLLLREGKKDAALAVARAVDAAGLPGVSEDTFRPWAETLSRAEALQDLTQLGSPERVSDPEVQVLYAAALHGLGRKEDALDFARATTTKPAVALGSEVAILVQDGKRDEAIALVRPRLSDPEAVVALRVLCDLLERRGDLEPIRGLVDPARSTDPSTLLILGRALVKLGRGDDARALGEKLANGPSSLRGTGVKILDAVDE